LAVDARICCARAACERIGELPDAEPLFESGGARLVLGASTDAGKLVEPIVPAANRLFGPRGTALAGPSGPLAVCDTGHHRLLLWIRVPEEDGAPADLVIGQPGFGFEGRNARGEVGPTTLNVPTGVAIGAGVLAVADAWNHRVLLWHGLPGRSNQPPDVVLGQVDFRSGDPNRGLTAARADTLRWCYGVAVHAGRLMVADTGNRRVLVWDGIPTVNGAPADLVLGQHDFAGRDDGAGAAPGATGMRWPHGIVAADELLFVADPGYSRVMVWRGLPGRNGAGCDFVLGQADMAGCDQNRAADRPSAASMNMPHGLAVLWNRLIVADTANSRLLGFETGGLAMGAAATRLAGQESFGEKRENGSRLPSRSGLCWPYAVAAYGRTLVIADSGNNRVLLWESA
jgi:hypothetical protein